MLAVVRRRACLLGGGCLFDARLGFSVPTHRLQHHYVKVLACIAPAAAALCSDDALCQTGFLIIAGGTVEPSAGPVVSHHQPASNLRRGPSTRAQGTSGSELIFREMHSTAGARRVSCPVATVTESTTRLGGTLISVACPISPSLSLSLDLARSLALSLSLSLSVD